MARILALLYGSVAYLVFLGTFLYAIGFVISTLYSIGNVFESYPAADFAASGRGMCSSAAHDMAPVGYLSPTRMESIVIASVGSAKISSL